MSASDSSKGYPKGIFDSCIYNTNPLYCVGLPFRIGNMIPTCNFQDPIGPRKTITVSGTLMDIYLLVSF